jgi:hypothetical protein
MEDFDQNHQNQNPGKSFFLPRFFIKSSTISLFFLLSIFFGGNAYDWRAWPEVKHDKYAPDKVLDQDFQALESDDTNLGLPPTDYQQRVLGLPEPQDQQFFNQSNPQSLNGSENPGQSSQSQNGDSSDHGTDENGQPETSGPHQRSSQNGSEEEASQTAPSDEGGKDRSSSGPSSENAPSDPSQSNDTQSSSPQAGAGAGADKNSLAGIGAALLSGLGSLKSKGGGDSDDSDGQFAPTSAQPASRITSQESHPLNKPKVITKNFVCNKSPVQCQKEWDSLVNSIESNSQYQILTKQMACNLGQQTTVPETTTPAQNKGQIPGQTELPSVPVTPSLPQSVPVAPPLPQSIPQNPLQHLPQLPNVPHQSVPVAPPPPQPIPHNPLQHLPQLPNVPHQ